MNEPLVSVVVIAYNSADYILETLESIAGQTYENIELVVADDASSDETVAITRKWMQEHGDRFHGCILNDAEKNQGIPGNLNAGIRRAGGKYIKTIAADDLLLPNCIADNVKGCEDMQVPYLFTWLVKFTDTPEGRKQWEEAPNLAFYQADPATQHKMLLRKNQIYGPLFFFEKAFWEEMGTYDEHYRMLEDYPMWIRMADKGLKFHFLNVPTVAYRISDTSVSNGSGRRVVNVRYFQCYRKFFYDMVFPELVRRGMFL